MDILENINSQVNTITENDISSWVIKDVMDHYTAKINYWAYKTNSDDSKNAVPALAIRAFKEEVKIKLIRALQLFILEKKYWQNSNYSLNVYLLSTIKNFAKSKYWVNKGLKRAVELICPACKVNNEYSFLISEKGLWRCHSCTNSKNEIEEHQASKTNIDEQEIIKTNDKYRLYKAFALHSRKGYKCPECNRFIPNSSKGQYGLTCPYESCTFSGEIKDLKVMSHPSAAARKNTLSLNAPNIICASVSYQDSLISDCSKPDTEMNCESQYSRERDVLSDVISKQIDLIKRSGVENTRIKKLLMYQAYRNMIEVYPEEMHSYLVLLQQNHDFPLQAKIFQEYVRLIENYLPITIQKNSETQDILSLTDPRLSLFLGKSTFNATVDGQRIIPNNTIETYVGGRKFTNYGPCFIGRLIDVIDNRTNNSIIDSVKEYNFIQIMMDQTVETNIPVTVSHFRIPSHYELGSLVYLQRIRRQIVDSVYFRLNNKKRPLKSDGKEITL